jgi:enoyl-CoA hydratase/carnithine racemase
MSVLLLEQAGAVKHLILNRPEKRNALNLALAEAIIAALEQAGTDGTRLIVFQGKGPVFCAGFDFSEFASSSAGDLLLQFVRIEQMLQAVAHCPVDTLALVQGAAVGAGADLLVACRHRIGAPGVQARFPGARFGLILGSNRLAQCVGAEVALSLIGAAEKTDAARMKEIGLIDELLEPALWPQRIHQILNQVNQVSAQTRAKLLQMMWVDTRAEDMAELVASASHPEIKKQIASYLNLSRT